MRRLTPPLFAMLALACSRPAPPAEDPATPAHPERVCRTTADLEAAWGQTCRVSGRYETRELTDKGGEVFRVWPVVVLDDGAEVLVGSIWKPSEMPSADTTARLRGQRVEATGTLHGEPPGSIQNIVMPCVSPVDALEAAR